MRTFLIVIVALPGIGAALALVLAFMYEPSAIAGGEHLMGFAGQLPPCSGCGLCGMSRAFSALSHGHVQNAVHFNRAVLVVWPLAWALFGVSAFGVFRLLRNPPQFFALPPAEGATA